MIRSSFARSFCLLLSLMLLATALAACGGAKTSGSTIDQIKKDGVLRIGTSPDYPPFESLDDKNNVIGFDIDIMTEVATKLGVKLEIVQMGFDNLIPALNAKKFEVMAAGVSVDEDRKKAVDFTRPYMAGNYAIVVHKDFSGKVTKLEDLKGKTVAVQIGTVQADDAKKIDGITVKEYNLFTEAKSAVSAKQADALYLDGTVGDAFVKADKNLKVIAELPAQPTAYALRKDTPDLTKYITGVLDEMEKNGKLDQLVQKWFK
ncbi:MAG: extracellular solute-binding protein family 3 [Symbiobacteriaceae bacterium]|jgi:polar amino acid transport system substrate-binding protein|nr:extracellular solute-binding protein family 3 [Symbiobacteriaceae bacterium]